MAGLALDGPAGVDAGIGVTAGELVATCSVSSEGCSGGSEFCCGFMATVLSLSVDFRRLPQLWQHEFLLELL